jgi:hypothetical protein
MTSPRALSDLLMCCASFRRSPERENMHDIIQPPFPTFKQAKAAMLLNGLFNEYVELGFGHVSWAAAKRRIIAYIFRTKSTDVQVA